ncbi:hypothetical protein D3C81_1474040 [compost metagenome]
MGAQAVSQGEQQLVADLIAELLVYAFEVVQAHAQYGDAMLQAAAVYKYLVELCL